jgi:1,4-dihydroxy-2-naphthoate octaprenyltransferase
MNERPSTLRVWATASRPHTLPASIAPVIVGAALSASYVRASEERDVNVAVLAIWFGFFACLIQLGTNLHNDYADFVKGADTDKRVGHARATQRGWLTPQQTAAGATLCLGVAFLIGAYLTTLPQEAAFPDPSSRHGGATLDSYMLFVTISSVFNAVAYTGGPYPLGYIGLGNLSLGYSGLGDLFVFLYFGLVAVITVPYMVFRLCDGETSSTSLVYDISKAKLLQTSALMAIPIGCISTCIIVVNNLRDRETDVGAGKRTMAVRFGAKFARVEYGFLMISSYVWVIHFARTYGLAFLSPLLSLPGAIEQLKAVALGEKDGAELNRHVGGTARVLLMFCLLLAFAITVTPLTF